MKAIPREDLADAVLRALRESYVEAVQVLPDVHASPRPAAALVVYQRTHQPELKPILVTDFYRKDA